MPAAAPCLTAPARPPDWPVRRPPCGRCPGYPPGITISPHALRTGTSFGPSWQTPHYDDITENRHDGGHSLSAPGILPGQLAANPARPDPRRAPRGRESGRQGDRGQPPPALRAGDSGSLSLAAERPPAGHHPDRPAAIRVHHQPRGHPVGGLIPPGGAVDRGVGHPAHAAEPDPEQPAGPEPDLAAAQAAVPVTAEQR